MSSSGGSAFRPTSNEEISLDFHQRNCVHRGPTNASPISSTESELQHSLHHWSFDSNTAKTLRRSVAKCCWFAGLFPSDISIFKYGYVWFDSQLESAVQIGYGPSNVENIQASLRPAAHADLVHQIWLATGCVCSAIRVLQDNGFCCDRLTMLTPDPERPADAVSLRPLPLKQVNTIWRFCKAYGTQ